MNTLFGNQKNSLVEDYERKLRELEALKDDQFNKMKTKLEQEIKALKDQLKKERENMSGNAQ